mmetsp:Transcript_16564/g.33317  ORF Transcript_16564/g.33317 Transcript_16564/m.33317 type:complete len:243 (+) Transcript_16564:385-1113(+)
MIELHHLLTKPCDLRFCLTYGFGCLRRIRFFLGHVTTRALIALPNRAVNGASRWSCGRWPRLHGNGGPTCVGALLSLRFALSKRRRRRVQRLRRQVRTIAPFPCRGLFTPYLRQHRLVTTTMLLLHCRLTANHRKKRLRGDRVTAMAHLACPLHTAGAAKARLIQTRRALATHGCEAAIALAAPPRALAAANTADVAAAETADGSPLVKDRLAWDAPPCLGREGEGATEGLRREEGGGRREQ